MKKLILLIVLITNFCIFNVSYSEPGNTHTGADAITAGMPTMEQIKYCMVDAKNPRSRCQGTINGKDINSGYIDCSGFSTWVYGQLGIKLAGGTAMQQDQIRNAGCKMSKDWKNIKAGDLIYKAPGGTGHVMIATGNVDNTTGLVEVIQSSGGKGTNRKFLSMKGYAGYFSAECVISHLPKGSSPPYTGTVGSAVVDEGTATTVTYKGGALGLDVLVPFDFGVVYIKGRSAQEQEALVLVPFDFGVVYITIVIF